MNNKTKVKKNFIYSIICQLALIAVGIILPRFFILGYGSEINGLIGSANQFVAYLYLFEAGIGATTLHALYRPIATDQKEEINSILSATNLYYKKAGLWYLIGLILLSMVYPFIVHSDINKWTIFFIMILSGLGNVILFWFQGKYKLLLQAEGKNYLLTNLSTIISIVISLAKIILISLGFDVVFILAVSFLIQTIQALYIIIYIKKKYRWINLKVNSNKSAISQKNFALIHEISGMIFTHTDLLILTVFCNLKIVSVYSLYQLIMTYISKIQATVMDSVEFLLGQTYNLSKKIYIEKVDFIDHLYCAFSSTLFSVTLFMFPHFMYLYTLGIKDINYVDNKLAILFITIAILKIMRQTMLLTIKIAGHFKQTSSKAIIESVINLTVSIIGVKLIGIYGVLLGTIAALIYRTNDVIIYSNKKILNRKPHKTYSIYLIGIVILIILQFVFNYCFNDITSYSKFILYGFITFFIASLCQFFAQFIIFKSFRYDILNFLHKRSKVNETQV